MVEPESSAVRRFDKDRFEIELEVDLSLFPVVIHMIDLIAKCGYVLARQFIQCLASPNYLYELASKGYLDDPCFLNYLEYLNYWRNPKYVQFILSVLRIKIPMRTCPRVHS
jgi:hypothetical protein